MLKRSVVQKYQTPTKVNASDQSIWFVKGLLDTDIKTLHSTYLF